MIAGPNALLYIFDPYGRVKYDIVSQHEIQREDVVPVLINLAGELIQYQGYALNEFPYILDFGKKIKDDNFSHQAQLQVIKNNDGSIKWLSKKNSIFAKYLTFFQTNSIRSKSIALLLKIVQLSRLNTILFSNFSLLGKEDFYFNKFDDINANEFSISFGPKGIEQKIVVAKHQANRRTQFVKLPINGYSKMLIERECRNLRIIKHYNLKDFIFPSVSKTSSGYGISTVDILKGTNPSPTFSNQHARALKEMTLHTLKHEKLSRTSFWSSILYNLDIIKNANSQKLDPAYKKLNYLKEKIKANTHIYSSLSHGDFTPWNARTGKKQLHIIDWEAMGKDYPVLFDLFYFIMQSTTLIQNKGEKEIHESIKEALDLPKVKYLINKFNINKTFYFQLFLLGYGSKYVAQFSKEKELNYAQSRILTNIVKACSLLQFETTSKDERALFLADLEARMKDQNYAWLKTSLDSFTQLSRTSDLDFVGDKKALNAIREFINDHYLVRSTSEVELSFMSTFDIHLMNGQYVSIDLIQEFVRKSKKYMDSKKVLLHARMKGQVKKPILEHNLLYIKNFYSLNDSFVPLKYSRLFEIYRTEVLPRTLNHVLSGAEQKIVLGSLLKVEEFKKVKKLVNRKNGLFKRIILSLKYVSDSIILFRKNRGEVITFSGVDGAGKTTILNEIKSILENKYRRKVVVLRHRPGILPILSSIKHGGKDEAEKVASSTLPRSGTNKSLISSTLRFAYYLTDYLVGQIYVKIKYSYRGITVIYDRYYFDFINDAKRSNITLKKQVIKWFYKFIDKPKSNFFLYNDPEVILSRKEELTRGEIVELTSNYHELFEDFSKNQKGNYYRLKNDHLGTSIQQIIHLINDKNAA